MIHINSCTLLILVFYYFFFNDTATTEIYTLSLHDALPISVRNLKITLLRLNGKRTFLSGSARIIYRYADRKSTRLNSSHANISYAVFCLKKKNKHEDFT